MSVQHQSKSDSWMTPPWIMDKVRNVLGEIDVDPASSEQANKVVKAKKIITESVDALSTPWMDVPSTVYLNPPGGKLGNQSKTKLFWQQLINYREEGLIVQAIFMAFSAEALQHTQIGCELSICDFPICIPSRRISFIDPIDGVGKQPSHSNVIVYIPGIENKVSLFKEEFDAVGKMLYPY